MILHMQLDASGGQLEVNFNHVHAKARFLNMSVQTSNSTMGVAETDIMNRAFTSLIINRHRFQTVPRGLS